MTVNAGARASQRATPNEALRDGSGPSRAPRARKRRGIRWRAWLGGCVGVALCLLIVNQWLVWRALGRLGESPLRLSYQGAISWVPGVLHVERAVVRPLGTSWSATAVRLRADLDITELLRGSFRIDELRANVVEWKDPKHGVVASGRFYVVARRIFGVGGTLHIDAAQVSLEKWQLRLGREDRAVLEGEARLLAIRASHTGKVALKVSGLQLRARLSREGSFRDVPLRISGRLSVSEGSLDPETLLTATLQEPLEVPLRHKVLRVSGGSALELATRTRELAMTGHIDDVTLRSPASNRQLLRLKNARLEPMSFTSLLDVGAKPLEIELRAAELVFDSGTDLGRLSSPVRIVTSVVRHDRPTWRITSALIELPQLHFSASAPHESPLRALVRLRQTGAAPDDAMPLQGDIQMQGDKLGALYPMLGVPQSVDLILSPFREQPFTASARLDSTATGFSLNALSVRTHTLELRGFLHFAADEKRGALLIVTPAATLGLSLHNEDRDVTMRPTENWLERQHAP